MNRFTPSFPTPLHRDVCDIILSFFGERPEVDSILLLNSCARGHATPQSDLDVAVLSAPNLTSSQLNHLIDQWLLFSKSNPIISIFNHSSPFSHVHLDFISGHYSPNVWDDGGGPDDFELEIGNHLVYSSLLSSPGPHFTELQDLWLPYYAHSLREPRLTMVRDACLYDLEHISFFNDRSLYFQAFDRLYKAFREFMQLLFIAQSRYPIAYNKWIYQQVVDILALDDLYPELVSILSVDNVESNNLVEKGRMLLHLVESWGFGDSTTASNNTST
ncbi:MAG: hypothetical protein AAF614_12345 [Chloroflexota bacterium]